MKASINDKNFTPVIVVPHSAGELLTCTVCGSVRLRKDANEAGWRFLSRLLHGELGGHYCAVCHALED